MKTLLKIASIAGLLGVMIGAFGAHLLKPFMSEDQLATFNTASKYHLIHSLSIILLAILYQQFQLKQFKTAAYFHLVGIILFAGSLYLIALKDYFQINHWTFLGPITPLGGLSFMIGWALLFIGSAKINHKN